MTIVRRQKIFHSFLLLLFITGCVAHRADLSAYYPSSQKPQISLFKNMEYDAQGLPFFGTILKERPTREGEQFTLVQFLDNKPVRSFDIVITSQKPDLTRPFKVIYEWTGKGFKTAAAAGKTYSDTALKDKETSTSNSTMLTPAETATVLGPVLVMSLGGFIVGVAASVPATIQELTHVVAGDYEKVISFSVYEYDDKQRLSGMKTYSPDDISHEIIKTVFFYRNNETAPSRTEITSYPENTVRTIP